MSNANTTETIVKGVVSAILYPLFIGAVMIVACLSNGLVVYHLWKWFATPLGVPALGFVQSMGIAILSLFLCSTSNLYRDKGLSDMEKLKSIGWGLFLHPLLTLLLGYILYCFMS